MGERKHHDPALARWVYVTQTPDMLRRQMVRHGLTLSPAQLASLALGPGICFDWRRFGFEESSNKGVVWW